MPKPIGKCPVVLLSRDSAYSVCNAAAVAEITTTIRNIPVEVLLETKDGLPKKCIANLDTIITIRKEKIVTKICTLSGVKMNKIDEAIKFALDLD